MDNYLRINDIINSNKKIRNIEMLRFVLAWAVVGFHMVNRFSDKGLGFMSDYVHALPHSSVPMFFVIAFFFLVIKARKEESLWSFCAGKWMRLAPFLVVITAIGYLLAMRFESGQWNSCNNLENILLVHEWGFAGTYGTFVNAAWWCSVYILVSIFYIGLIKTFAEKYVAFIVGISAYIGWRIYVLHPSLPLYDSIIGHYKIGMALFSLGLAYALVHAPRIPSFMRKNRWIVVGGTLAEISLFLLLVGWLYAYKYFHAIGLILILPAFTILLWLFIHRVGYFSRILDQNVSVFLGRYTYAIYISHLLVLYIGQKLVVKWDVQWIMNNPFLMLGSMALSIILLAMLGHHLIELPSIRAWRRWKLWVSEQSV